MSNHVQTDLHRAAALRCRDKIARQTLDLSRRVEAHIRGHLKDDEHIVGHENDYLAGSPWIDLRVSHDAGHVLARWIIAGRRLIFIPHPTVLVGLTRHLPLEHRPLLCVHGKDEIDAVLNGPRTGW